MAKLYFYYSAMNAGKSTTLLQSSYNYQERGMDTLLLTPKIDTRYGEGLIASRIGLSAPAFTFDNNTNLYEYIATALNQPDHKIKCVLVDEAQFLTKQHVMQLATAVDDLKIPVLTYGIRSDFMSEPFEGSKYLLTLADELIEIKTICHCGSKAIMNKRIDENGKAVRQGEQVEIGGNDRYIAVCRKHYFAD